MYHVTYDTENFCDGYNVESIEHGQDGCYEILMSWQMEHEWFGKRMPTEKEIEDWDGMIENCSVWVSDMPDDYSVEKYPDMSSWDRCVWVPDEERLKGMLWNPWEEIKADT